MNVQVDERTLNEIYLPPDENAVKLGHTAAIMGALNKVNGEADLPTLGRSSPACYLDQARNRDSFNHPSQARRLPTQNRLATALHSLGWEHINLTADDAWRPDGGVRNRRLRLLGLETQRYVPWRTISHNRQCLCCDEFYAPDHRNVRHQRYCSKPACRTQSKALSQRRW